MKALVVLSGGTDSAVALSVALLRRSYPEPNSDHTDDEIEAITFDYGQKMIRELKAAAAIANRFGIRWTVLQLTRAMFHGALVDGPDIPFGKLEEIKPVGTSPAEVPFRNGIFISAATAVAIEKGATEIWHGIHAGDGTEWAYPDNAPEFLGAMAAAVWIGSAHRVRLFSPFEWMTKASVIRRGIELGTPFSLTYSCYAGQYPSCGECVACRARIEAFRQNRVLDPIQYQADAMGRSALHRYGAYEAAASNRKSYVDDPT